ncbi:MAG: 2Fe-2S iron-sulfur cluster binding domain-containing protein [Cellvibrionaceae bacterium]
MSNFTVKYAGESIVVSVGESLLDAVLRRDIELPHSCCNGICQTCLVKITEGDIPEVSQLGLKENQKKQNLALACQLKPIADLSAQPASHTNKLEAIVVGHELISADVLRLRLEGTVNWLPGQYANLWKNDKAGRPYSIASLTQEGFLEFHIKRHDQGDVSQWLHDYVTIGQRIIMSNPLGACSYGEEMKQKPLLLLGVGTGLAPLYGVAREALRMNHKEEIHLYIGEKTQQGLYLTGELFQLDQDHKNFQYYPIVRDQKIIPEKQDKNSSLFLSGDIVEIIKNRYPSLQEWCVFICGSPMLVRKLQRHCFMNGASISNIHTDPFITK